MERRVVVGLGNVGPRYASTRHNAGFWLLEVLARELNATWSPAGAQVQIAEVVFEGTKVWLVKPQQLMNRSGESLAAWARSNGFDPSQFLIAADDVYLKPGTARFRQGGGHGGHNGWKSLISHGFAEAHRLRIGVGLYDQRPEAIHQPALDAYVLAPLPASDREKVDDLFDQITPTVLEFLRTGVILAETHHTL